MKYQRNIFKRIIPVFSLTFNCRDDEASKWRTWLIVAIFLTMFLAAAATAVIMKFCCMSSGDVSPRLEPA